MIDNTCRHCGGKLKEDAQYCEHCGAIVARERTGASRRIAADAPDDRGGYAGRESEYLREEYDENDDAIDAQIEPLGAFNIAGSVILMSIPLIGWIIAIVWAASAQNVNRKNLARGMIILFVIGLVLSFVALAVVSVIISNMGLDMDAIGSLLQ